MNTLGIKLFVFISMFSITVFFFLFLANENNTNIENFINLDYKDIQERNALKLSNSFNLSENYLNDEQLNKLDKTELSILRNEIFAKHGYIFQREDLRIYFSQFSWYRPQYNSVSHMLNEIELYNIEKIKQYE